MSRPCHCHKVLAAMLCLALGAGAWAARVSDVSNTPHNLSVTGPGPVRAVSESQICVFCHTPGGEHSRRAALEPHPVRRDLHAVHVELHQRG
jgi:hypothetical protein